MGKFTSVETKTRMMVGGGMEKKSPSQALWPLRKQRNILGAKDAGPRAWTSEEESWLSDHLEAGKRIQCVPSPPLAHESGAVLSSHLGAAASLAKVTGLKGSEGVLFPAKRDWA